MVFLIHEKTGPRLLSITTNFQPGKGVHHPTSS